MTRALLALTILMTQSEPVAALDFQDAAAWELDCTVAPVARKNFYCFPDAGCGPRVVKINWWRDRGEARILWGGGDGKGMREIPGFTDGSGQSTAHFWYSPATAKYTSPSTLASRFGGWVEGFGPTLVSLRATGEIAMTGHDIINGGMQARTEEGSCDIRPLTPKEN